MQLSIIIVNYNVKYFLEQCLCSVQQAMATIEAEVIVVDNCSVDNSVDYLQQQFPFVQFIKNETNVGFGKANNIGASVAKGNYLLFLNPDTLVPEDCFTKCIRFFETHTNCGALGIKMLDGSGSFLPESKRAFPTPFTAFFKLIGAASLLPTSAIFNKYALGNLDANKNHEVDVLAGAFMLIKKNIFQASKGFDENFFMYGEDVDLSYRIQKMGYKNFYFSESCIIHFKGESTKRGSLNYVKMFYEAMSIFVSKHYHTTTATLFSTSIKIAIWIRALISLFIAFITHWGIVLLDALITYSCFVLVQKNWVIFVRDGKHFPDWLVTISIPSYSFVFLLAATLFGLYDNLYKPAKVIIASLVALIIILAVYSLMPENYRFSRGVIITSTIVTGLSITLLRLLLIWLQWIKPTEETNKIKQTVIVGSLQDYQLVVNLLQQAELQERILGRVDCAINNETTIGTIQQLPLLIKKLRIKEIIFAVGKEVSYKDAITYIQQLPKSICFKFMGNHTHSIISSDNKTTTGETLTAEGFYQINIPYQKRIKRLIDVAFALFFLLTMPIHFIFCSDKKLFLIRTVLVLIGKKTWVGYILSPQKLPIIKPSILVHTPIAITTKQKMQPDALFQLDMLYVKYYDWWQDVKTIVQQYKNISAI